MNQTSDWWEPDNLANYEKEVRTKFAVDDFDVSGDFGSYKAIKEGIDIKDSNLAYHNVCKEEKLKNVLVDYIKLLKKENYNSPKTIADIGCGAGFTTNALKKVYVNSMVYGYEISHDAVEYAKINFPNCQFEQKKINPISDLSEIKFDFILCQEFYPFTRTKDHKIHSQWLKFLLNNLKKDGIALITVSSSSVESINYSYESLKNDFPLKKIILAHPRLSSKIPFLLSRLMGEIAALTWKRLGRQIYFLKNV